MNDIIYLSSDNEDDKIVVHTHDVFDDEKPHPKPVSSGLTVEDDEDEDCVVLDGDPYNTKEKGTVSNTYATDDDILILGQKGEIACRDFPHPRHACAKYPFSTTSHDKYCDMCHCYVCDTPAPCPHWCNGISTIDHCHANDKELIWKNQRECIRTGNLLPLQNSTWYSPVNQFGPSTMVAPRPNTYIRPGYTPEQSRTFPKTNAFRPRPPQLFQNQSGGFYNCNPSPQVFSSTWTQRPNENATLVENGIHNRYTYPPTALQGSSQQIYADYVSTLSSSHINMYGRQFSRPSAVPSRTPNPPAKQQQQERSINRVLTEIEDWLMDIGQHYPD